MMGRAIAHWQARQSEDALKDFELIAKTAPEWNNPQWVKMLFPASAAQSVAEMGVAWQTKYAARR